ncbi:MAG: DCC1-like thiol-disulfide oxidoreductase family protein [Verrucomicrobiae bacterium]|nr:DCC1-like thiol-disulfide oxidoreductase family protein [Verrucomicrobiae bacterium]
MRCNPAGVGVRGRVEELFDMGGRVLVLFDGHCGLCNGAVRWLLRRDRGDRLRFMALQSEKAARVLARYGMNGAQLETMVVVRDAGGAEESVLARSDAAVALLRELARPWPWVGTALRWVPRPVRDAGYRLVAWGRYRIWGRLESCPLPTAEERERFL